MTAPTPPPVTVADLQARVAAGARWLDAQMPGWHDRVDLDRLVTRRSGCCVLGQLYGDYYQAPLALERAVAYGFDTALGAQPHDRDDPRSAAAKADEFDALDHLWRAAVHARRPVDDHPRPARAAR